jgi:hypothetical protein
MNKPASDCDWCNGIGWIVVYHRDSGLGKTPMGYRRSIFGRVLHGVPVPPQIAVPCCCDLGIAIAEQQSQERRQLITIADVFCSRVPYGLVRPDEDNPSPSFELGNGETFSSAVARMIKSRLGALAPTRKTPEQIREELETRSA